MLDPPLNCHKAAVEASYTVPASVANDIEEMLVLTMYIIYTYMYMCTHYEEPMCFSVLSSTTLPSSSILQKKQPTAISLTSTFCGEDKTKTF